MAPSAEQVREPDDPNSSELLRVMIVDDAIAIRGVFAKWLENEANIRVVSLCRDGQEVIDTFERVRPDLILLDIEMPGISGIEVLRFIRKKDKRVNIFIISGTADVKNAYYEKAMELGATDFMHKPSGQLVASAEALKRDIIFKCKELAKKKQKYSRLLNKAQARNFVADERLDFPSQSKKSSALRPYNTTYKPRVLVIGSSTGGPMALAKLFSGLGSELDRLPVLITQHMPPSFTKVLAGHIGASSGRPAKEAEDGEMPRNGCIYVAPGGKHMSLKFQDSVTQISITDEDPINFCKPSVEPLFKSAAALFGNKTLAFMLTGMGSDGAVGAMDIANAGGNVIAQDEETSTVWGMPGAAVQIGACCDILPLTDMPEKIKNLINGK